MKVSSPVIGLSSFRTRRAFTLVEMLVVIGIIALLAALIVGLMPAAVAKMRRARVEAEREALITYIEAYHKAKGFYPPSNTFNTNDTVQNTLFYELTGAILTNGGTAFVSPFAPQQPILSTTLTANFGVAGIFNASADPAEVKNFCGAALKPAQYATVSLNPGPGSNIVFGIPVDGAKITTLDRGLFNPWHYVSANPTNNPDSYDLWIDVILSGNKTNRISNWSKDPQPLGP